MNETIECGGPGDYQASQIGTCHPGQPWQGMARHMHPLSPPWNAGSDHPANSPIPQGSKWRTTKSRKQISEVASRCNRSLKLMQE
jgi:hypothetical protein